MQLGLMGRLEPPYVSYAGVDWGGGEHAFTVIWIMARDDQDRWRLIFVRKFQERDPMRQVEIIANLITLFNVKQAVADIVCGPDNCDYECRGQRSQVPLVGLCIRVKIQSVEKPGAACFVL